MAARSRLVDAGLGHERDRLALEVCDLLGAVLVDGVVVGHGQRVGVPEVELVLAGSGLPLGELDRQTRGDHPVAQGPDQRLVLGGLQHVVVEVVPAARPLSEVAVVVAGELVVAGVVGEQLELGTDHDHQIALGGPLDLVLQDLAGRHRDGGVVRVVEHVGEHQRRALEPRRDAQGREVGSAPEVAVAGLPVGEPVALDHVHVDVDGQEVVARFDALTAGGRAVRPEDVVEEEPTGHPLAHQPALEVGEGDDDGVDGAVVDQPGEGRYVDQT